MSRNHIILIVFVIIGVQLFGHAVEGIFVVRHKEVLGKIGIRATCITEDDGDAVIWNKLMREFDETFTREIIEDFPASIGTKEPNCPLGKHDECTKQWLANSTDWQFSSSIEKPMGPVFDNRWEAFKEYFYGWQNLLYHEYNSVSEINSWNTLVFSTCNLRTTSFIFYLNSNETEISYYRFIIRDDPKIYEIDECKGILSGTICRTLNIEMSYDIMSQNEWVTFILKLSKSNREIQVYKENKLVIAASIPEEIPQNVPRLKMFGSGHGYIRFHKYDYLHTEKVGNVLISPPWQNISPKICIEMVIGLCDDCKMTFLLVDNQNKEHAMKTVYGSDVMSVPELPAWRRVKIESVVPVGFSDSIRLKILTEHKLPENGLWAVAMFRKCATADDIRSSTIKVSVRSFVAYNYLEYYSCQKLSYDNSNYVSLVGPDWTRASPCSTLCPVGKVRPQCTVTCPDSSCKYVSVCDETGCHCAQGYIDHYCSERLEDRGYDNCQNSCGQCKDGAAYSNITGNCDHGCDNNVRFHFESVSDTVMNPPMTPEIDILNYTHVRIKVPINREYHKADTKIGINILNYINIYREIENNTQYVETEISLRHGTLYQVQITAYVTLKNYKITRSITNFTTPCDDGKIKVETQETSVIVSVTSDHEYSCSSNWYDVTLESDDTTFKGSPISNTKLKYVFDNLTPYTPYRLLVRHEQKLYYNKTIVTLQDSELIGETPCDFNTSTAPCAASTQVQNLRTITISEDTVMISWDPPAKANASLTGYTITTKRIVMLGCQDYNRLSPPWVNETILEANSNSLILNGLHPYSEYSVQVVAKTMTSEPSVQAHFQTPARRIPTSIVSHLTIYNLLISWKPPEDCSTITGPTEKVAVVVQGVSENVATFQIKRQTTWDNLNFLNEALHGNELYMVRVYVIREYNDTLDDTPYQSLTFKTNAMAPPAVTNFEIVEMNTDTARVTVRWDKPLPPTNGNISSYKIYMLNDNIEFVKSVDVDTETRCDLWPELYCMTTQYEKYESMQIGVCAINEGVAICGELSKLRIQKDANNLQVPEAPRSIGTELTNSGKIYLTWSHPWKTYKPISKFFITVETLSTNLPRESIKLDNSITIEYSICNYKREYIHMLNLDPSKSYKISVKARTVYDVLGHMNFTEVSTKLSTNLKGNLDPKNNEDMRKCEW